MEMYQKNSYSKTENGNAWSNFVFSWHVLNVDQIKRKTKTASAKLCAVLLVLLCVSEDIQDENC